MISSTEFLYAGNDVSEEVEHHCEGEAGSPRARTGPSGCGASFFPISNAKMATTAPATSLAKRIWLFACCESEP